MSALLALALLTCGVLLPGHCLARRLLPASDLLERVVFGAGLGLTLVPAGVFVLAWILEQAFTPVLVLLVALGIVVACRPWSFAPARRASPAHALAVLILLAVSSSLLAFTQLWAGSGQELFTPCLYEGALAMNQHDASGWALYDPHLGRFVTHVMSHRSAPVLGLQGLYDATRPANSAILAVLLLLMGRAGVEMTAVLFFFTIGGAAALVARACLTSVAAGVAVGVATLVGMHGLIDYMVNETTFALGAGLLVLAALVRPGRGAKELVVVGALLGFAVGSRMAALAWLLPVWLATRRAPRREQLAAAGAFGVSVLPWLVVPALLKGDPFYHHFGPSTLVSHSLLGFELVTRPLNWPVHGELVRAPGHLLPPLLLLPVLTLRSAGSLLVSATLVGAALLWRKEHRAPHAWVFLTWMAPITALLLLLAHIDSEKASWLLLGAPVLPLALACFLAALGRREARRQGLAAWAVWAAWGSLAALLAFAPGWLTRVELPEDPRGYAITPPIEEGLQLDAASRRRELGRLALLPSLQEASSSDERALVDSLLHAGGGEAFGSGDIVVWLPDSDSGEVTFPVRATSGDSATFDLWPQLPLDLVAGEAQPLFYVHLRLATAPEAMVTIAKRHGAYRIAIAAGAPPHAERTLSFLVDNRTAANFDGLELSVDGRPLPVRRMGYVLRGGGLEAAYRDLRLVTNVAELRELPPRLRARAEGDYGRTPVRADFGSDGGPSEPSDPGGEGGVTP